MSIVYASVSGVALFIAIFIFIKKCRRLLDALFYYPVLLLFFFVVCFTINFSFFDFSIKETGYVLFVFLNIIALILLALFLPRRVISKKMENEVYRRADIIITGYILKNKFTLSQDDIDYIQNSDLTTNQKKSALKYIANKKYNSSEAVKRVLGNS